MVNPVVTVPRPPDPFDALSLTLESGTVICRVHHVSRGAREFNPGQGAPSRFAPLDVPTLYAAATLEAAISETVLHDVPLTTGTLPMRSYAGYVSTSITVGRDLNLAKLMGDGLRRVGVTPQQLTATEGDVYGSTVLWSEAAHAAGFDGIAWMSARDNESQAYMFFGDCVPESSLQEVHGSRVMFAPGDDGFPWLATYCARVGVELLIE